MKIKTIRYQNFRNFAKPGEIRFDTDGKMTIIYGTNGDGKTTLHQLFQWVLYEKVTFNKTTSGTKLYNLEIGKKLPCDSQTRVCGEIEFEHNSIDYLVRREWVYLKNRSGDIIRKMDGDEFFVQRRTSSSDWRLVDNPELLIEEVLPSGLAPYFFFDGETMIADLKIRGTDSAKKLRKALYSIFELEVYENALRDIGNTRKTSSVLGSLETKRLDELKKSTSETQMQQYLKEIKIYRTRIEQITAENEGFEKRIKKYSERITEISEEVGSNQSKKALENTRKTLKAAIDTENDNIKSIMLSFGKEIEENYSHLLITEVVKSADKRLYLQVEDEQKKIIPGLTKELLINLLHEDCDATCICGHSLGDNERKRIEEWIGYFPPASYKSTYDAFSRNAIRFSGKYKEDVLVSYMSKLVAAKKRIRDLENQVDELEDQIKKTGNVDDLLAERKQLEEEVKKLNGNIRQNESNKGDFEHQLRIRERKTDSIRKSGSKIYQFENQIDIMNQVSAYIKRKLIDETKEYSSMLEEEIQNLIDVMLTSRRKVFLTDEFQLQVKDSYDDESKSEGQFAVISFAYIGGILKVLKEHEKLSGKEYPLILDGPFSKLDPEQKRNVVTTIPKYAPQVVIFSKDPLNEFVNKNEVGSVYTICSNDEKNNAEVREGYLWK